MGRPRKIQAEESKPAAPAPSAPATTVEKPVNDATAIYRALRSHRRAAEIDSARAALAKIEWSRK